MNVWINSPLKEGTLEIISSKSLTHRAIIAAALAKGKSVVRKPLHSLDTYATIDMLRKLGVVINIHDDHLEIISDGIKPTEDVLYANESGSSLRFLVPVALLNEGVHTFDGAPGLQKRPQNEYINLFKQMKLDFKQNEQNLPLKIYGKLQSGRYHLRGDISSQFISGLLFAFPLLEEDSEIILDTPLESKDYVLMTISVLKSFGIKIIHQNNIFYIPGNQKYRDNDYTISGDFSQFAFFFIAGILGANLTLKNLSLNTHQADEKVLEFVEMMKGDYLLENGSIKPIKSNTKGAVIDLSQSPDIGPIMAVLCALSDGKSEIINASRLRIKESDRITAITTELKKMGAKISETKDGMKIEGVKRLKGNVILDGWNDHRIVMALSIAALKADGPICIKGAEAVQKSYPTFFDDYMKLKGDISYE